MAKQTTSRPATRPAADNVARGVRSPSIVTFFQESRAELRKVTWPTRQETLNLTAAVVVMTVFMAVFLGIVDYVLNFLVKPILG